MPERILTRMDTRTRWRVATLFMLAMSLLVLFLTGFAWNQKSQLDKAEGELAANEAAERSAQVIQCFNSVQNRPVFVGAVQGLLTGLDKQIEGLTRAIENPTAGIIDTAERINDRELLRKSRANVERLLDVYMANSPTNEQECVDLANDLGVDPTPFKNPKRGGTQRR